MMDADMMTMAKGSAPDTAARAVTTPDATISPSTMGGSAAFATGNQACVEKRF